MQKTKTHTHTHTQKKNSKEIRGEKNWVAVFLLGPEFILRFIVIICSLPQLPQLLAVNNVSLLSGKTLMSAPILAVDFIFLSPLPLGA